MANETNFFSDKFLIWKETTKGETPATIAKAFSTKLLSFDLKEEQNKETNPLLGAGGQAPSTDYGSSSFSGNLECKYTGGIMPILLTHAIGTPSSKGDATASVWEAGTVYAVGDIVNHSDNTHSLVVKSVKGTGTSDAATEPNLTGLNDGDTVIDNPGDNQITWIVRPKLYTASGSLQPCLETFGVESVVKTGCETTPVYFKERYNGLFIDSLSLEKTAGTVIYKYSVPVIGLNRTDSSQDGFTELTITSEEVIADNAFGFEEMKVTFAGLEPKDARAFSMNITRGTKVDDAVAVGAKLDNTPIPTVSGELTLKFTIEEYTSAYQNSTKELIVTLAKANGDKVIFTFPEVELQRSPLSYSTDEPIYLTIPLNAVGNSSVATVNYTYISATDY